MSKPFEPNSLHVVGPLMMELNHRGLMDHFQLMGGIGAAVLKHPGTVIDADNQLIIAPKDFAQSASDIGLRRANGTLRDVDALVLSDDPAYIHEVETVVREEVEGSLEVSVFGLRSAAHLRQQHEHPYGIKSVKTFLSDRYIDTDGSMVKALTPFSVPVPDEAMESWTALIDPWTFPVMSPAACLANYVSRSISGLRPKDAEKVHVIAGYVSAKWPGAAEWLNDGPGQSQVELARILHTLRWGDGGKDGPKTLNVGNLMQLTSGSVPALREHEAFMYKDADEGLQDRVLKMAAFKSRLLGRTESREAAVQIFQKFFEQKLGTITKNK